MNGMTKFASMGAVFALAAMMTACGPEANDNASAPTETKAASEAVIDMTQPVDMAVLTVARGGAGVATTGLSFDRAPISLAGCNQIVKDAGSSNYSYARISCFNQGKYSHSK